MGSHRRRRGLLVAIALVAVALTGCRAFVFPDAADPGSPGVLTSSAVTVTNPTADRFFLRVQLLRCDQVDPDGVVVSDGSTATPITTLGLCGSGPDQGLLWNLADPGPPGAPPFDLFVLEPGASLSLTARATPSPGLLGRSLPFDVYGDWCDGTCHDIVRFT